LVYGKGVMNWKQHKKKWEGCQRCVLCKKRKKVVLAKGTLPCEILFVGEAPGQSEDVMGIPFVGPAGKLFEKIVAAGLKDTDYTFAMTNIIACIPKDETGRKVAVGSDIPKEAIQECSTRLEEFIELAKPDAIVWVGGLSAKKGPAALGEDSKAIQATIIHPAAIIRANVANQSLPIQRSIATIRGVAEELIPF